MNFLKRDQFEKDRYENRSEDRAEVRADDRDEDRDTDRDRIIGASLSSVALAVAIGPLRSEQHLKK